MGALLDSLKGARRAWWYGAAALLAVALLIVGKNLPRQTESGAVRTGDELRLAQALSAIEGAGRVDIVITRDDGGAVVGVLAVASGCTDLRVLLELQRAVMTLLDVEASRVEIIGGRPLGEATG